MEQYNNRCIIFTGVDKITSIERYINYNNISFDQNEQFRSLQLPTFEESFTDKMSIGKNQNTAPINATQTPKAEAIDNPPSPTSSDSEASNSSTEQAPERKPSRSTY